jgi:hypothetical protein
MKKGTNPNLDTPTPALQMVPRMVVVVVVGGLDETLGSSKQSFHFSSSNFQKEKFLSSSYNENNFSFLEK